MIPVKTYETGSEFDIVENSRHFFSGHGVVLKYKICDVQWIARSVCQLNYWPAVSLR